MAIFPLGLEGLVTDAPVLAEEVELTTELQETLILRTLDAFVGTDTTEEPVIVQTMEVEAHTQQWILSNDDIIYQNNINPDPWFLSMINTSLDTSTLSTNVADLINQFENFKDGVTLQYGHMQTADDELAYQLNVVKVSNDSNTAGIQELNTTKITADEARAVSENTIAAWSSGAGAAWFNSKISAVSTLAYSAAKSASNLTASINSQQDQLLSIVGDVDNLAKQIDGVVETWFDTQDVVDANGNLLETAEPYASWLSPDTRSLHTGDSYVKYETDANGNRVYISSFRFAKSAINEPQTDADGYVWVAVSDSKAEDAYQLALTAQSIADGKIVTWYQTYPPVFADATAKANGIGDLWLDSDDSNKLYRYNGSEWLPVSDTRVQASVERLDEATVTIDGVARAKSSLTTNANGVISGYVADSGDTSSFRIFADSFTLTNSVNGTDAGAPFYVDTNTNKIKFNGEVSFSDITGGEDVVLKSALATNDGTTIINGGNIRTGSISANIINGGVIYNLGANSTNYTMKIDLNLGSIHIR